MRLKNFIYNNSRLFLNRFNLVLLAVIFAIQIVGCNETDDDPEVSPSPEFVSAIVENEMPYDVVATFTKEVILTDSAGFNIQVNSVSATINSVSGDGTDTLTFRLDMDVIFDDDVTISYDSSMGNAEDTSSNPLMSFGPVNVTNNVDFQFDYLIDYVSSEGSFTYDLYVGSDPKDVYFIFTNTSATTDVAPPTVSSNNYSFSKNRAPNTGRQENINLDELFPRGIGLIGKSEITEFNRISPAYFNKNENSNNIVFPEPEAPLLYAIDDAYNFMNTSTSDLIPSTCRYVGSTVYKTLIIWVANDCWHIGGTKANLVTPEMINTIADKFLITGDDNDIYDWVANIFGEEWGAHDYSNLIVDDDEITILLFDIDNDNSTTGGVGGFFWAKDNFLTSSIDYSNERIMFYLDAVMLATPDGETWEMSDYLPASLVSALAHEFQHMIHFYQKAVLRTSDNNSETWLNELCSMAAEDIVADKLQVNGPRGVAYNDYSAGAANNTVGRLPLYNYYNDVPVTAWLSYPDVLKSYAVNYAFGSYLIRNFGGDQFLTDVVQNTYTDYQAIEYALSQAGSSDDFSKILRRWGAANLLSDLTNIQSSDNVTYNNSSSGFDFGDYKAGSINLYNYEYDSYDGPYIWSSLPDTDRGYLSNTYYHAANDITGQQSWDITLPDDMKLTVVVK
ncbi:MAG: hypothetical protein SVR08_10905 [Spirochaetota bacterium]|nr:hypothetical protein [Spirochaetota bacterium]